MRVLLAEPRDSVFDALSKALARSKVRCEPLSEADIDAVLSRQSEAGGECAVLVGGVADQSRFVERLRGEEFRGPILALLDLRSSDDVIRLLGSGADDALVKPINPGEAVARIQAIRRRGHGHVTASLRIGRLTVYFDGRDPEVDGRRLKLSHREHAIFTHLALQAGKVVSKNSVYEAVYGMMDSQPFDKVIDVYICKLRKKIANATAGAQYIETVYGRGYKLDEPVEATSDGASDDIADATAA